jgi:hypothetical protein
MKLYYLVYVYDLIAMMVQAWTDTLDIYSIRIGINYGFVAQCLRSLVIEKIETEMSLYVRWSKNRFGQA